MTTSLLILEADVPPREVVPRGDRLEIGRTPEADIVLHDHSVSRRHAVVRRVGADVLIEDEGSTYGTCVNGRALPAGRLFVLRDGDVLELGKVRLVFRRERAALPSDAAFAAEANARIIVLEANAVRRWAVSGPATLIGSAPHCDVRLADPLGPPEEALIRAEGGCFWLVPRCPSSPPCLDGGSVPVTDPALLSPCSVIALRRGQCLFLHDPGEPSEDPLRGVSHRRLCRRVALRTGVSPRRLREILGDRRGILAGEALVESRVLTPLSWRSIATLLLDERRRPWWRRILGGPRK